MNLKSLIVLGFGMLTLVSIPSPAHAVSHRTAKATVNNLTGQRMVYATILHKYSDNYKNFRTWANLPDGTNTNASPLTVQYHTGFGTTGRDWWMVEWKAVDGRTCVTNPNNFQGSINQVEGFLHGNAGKAGNKVGAVLGEAAGGYLAGPPGGVVGSQVGGPVGEAGANELADALFNSESTVGFKQHILRSEDEGKIVSISLYNNGEARIESPSGVSNTVYKCSEPEYPLPGSGTEAKPPNNADEPKPGVGSFGRVGVPLSSPEPICDVARRARVRNSPAAPNLEAQCLQFKLQHGAFELERPPVGLERN